jgi:H+-transporting ATPase
VIATTLAVGGIAMTRLPATLVAATLAAAVVYSLLLNVLKIPLFAHLFNGHHNTDCSSREAVAIS